uniref:Co-chaperonin GroES n=1 Tax=uncultured virus TaxID=340016 RepID=A0A221S489_9VIRU|nr:co-chaperonin GroES [uncultured virus]
MKLNAVFDAVIVKPIEENETRHGSIVIPDMGKEKNLTGEVVAVGPGKYSISGTFIPTTLSVGQKVILPQMGPVKVEIDREDYYVCSENTILAIINE